MRWIGRVEALTNRITFRLKGVQSVAASSVKESDGELTAFLLSVLEESVRETKKLLEEVT